MGQGSLSPGGGGSSRGGRSSTNMAVKQGSITPADAPQDNDTRTGERRGEDVEKDSLRLRSRKEASWFAALPRGIRKAMRSRVKKSLPRGYEERLKKYFESLD